MAGVPGKGRRSFAEEAIVTEEESASQKRINNNRNKLIDRQEARSKLALRKAGINETASVDEKICLVQKILIDKLLAEALILGLQEAHEFPSEENKVHDKYCMSRVKDFLSIVKQLDDAKCISKEFDSNIIDGSYVMPDDHKSALENARKMLDKMTK